MEEEKERAKEETAVNLMIEQGREQAAREVSLNLIKDGWTLKFVEDIAKRDIYTILKWIPKEQLDELLGRAKCREISLRLIERGDSIESVAEIVGVESSMIQSWINIEKYREGFKEGEARGRAEKCKEMAIRLNEREVPVETIAYAAKADISVIRKWIDENKSIEGAFENAAEAFAGEAQKAGFEMESELQEYMKKLRKEREEIL